MAARTSLLEVKLPEEAMRNPVEKVKIGQEVKRLLTNLELEPFDNDKSSAKDDGFTLFFTGSNGSYAVARGYTDGLITIDLNERPASGEQKFTKELVEDIVTKLEKSFSGSNNSCLPTIRRGDDVKRYFPTTDGLLVEYDFDKCVFEEDSPYQNIKIMHSNQYGNILILDDDLNLAESDLAYTHAITGHGHEDYRDKTVLILGGGDGGILHELLKDKPRHITMVDIDGIVVEAATKHLRGICYDSLDKLKGDNYEVIIADCVPTLNKYAEEGKLFDYVINDLTAIPCTTEPIGDHWDFLRLILTLSMQVLSPTGKYYTQGNGFNMGSALKMYEKQLEKLPSPVSFRTNVVGVPSYCEMWVFYEIWKTQKDKVPSTDK